MVTPHIFHSLEYVHLNTSECSKSADGLQLQCRPLQNSFKRAGQTWLFFHNFHNGDILDFLLKFLPKPVLKSGLF